MTISPTELSSASTFANFLLPHSSGTKQLNNAGFTFTWLLRDGKPKVTLPNPTVKFASQVTSMKNQIGKTESTGQDHLPEETNIAQRHAPNVGTLDFSKVLC